MIRRQRLLFDLRSSGAASKSGDAGKRRGGLEKLPAEEQEPKGEQCSYCNEEKADRATTGKGAPG